MLAKTKDGEIIHIKDALIKTDYFCGECGGRLRVRNGKIKVKHFYHLNADCGDRGESLIHLYWKNYFSNLKEFDGYNIVASMQEVHLKNTGYTPDVVLKTNKGTYLAIEVCYKNPKDESYKSKFERIKDLEKVYEVEVDFDGILNTKILFDIEKEKRIKKKCEELKEEAELIREYILKRYYDDGGIFFYESDHMPFYGFILHKDLKPKYSYEYNKRTGRWVKYNLSSSLQYKKFKVCLLRKLKFEGEVISEESRPFYIKIYDYKNLKGHLEWADGFGEFRSDYVIMHNLFKNPEGTFEVIFRDNI